MGVQQFVIARGQHRRPICRHCGAVLIGSVRPIARVANSPKIYSHSGTTYRIIAKTKTLAGYLVIVWVSRVFLRCFYAKQGKLLRNHYLGGNCQHLNRAPLFF